MQKKRNTNSVLKKQKFIKKPNEEATNTNKYSKHNKALEKNNTQPLSLAFDISDISNSENNKLSKSSRTLNQKSILTEKLNKLKNEFESALQTKKKLEAEVYSAKIKANKSFSQTTDSAELNTNLQILRQKLNKTQTKYKSNLKLIEQMKSQLDEYRITKLSLHSGKNKDSIQEAQNKNEYLKKSPNPIINELNQRSNELFQKTDEFQSILGKVLDFTGMKNINEVFYEAERIERENKNIDHYLTMNEPILPKLIEKRDELKKNCDELLIQRKKETETQNEMLHDMSIDFSNIQIHLSEIETQKKKDESSFSDVFFEIEQIYDILGCDFYDLSNDQAKDSEMLSEDEEEERKVNNETETNEQTENEEEEMEKNDQENYDSESNEQTENYETESNEQGSYETESNEQTENSETESNEQENYYTENSEEENNEQIENNEQNKIENDEVEAELNKQTENKENETESNEQTDDDHTESSKQIELAETIINDTESSEQQHKDDQNEKKQEETTEINPIKIDKNTTPAKKDSKEEFRSNVFNLKTITTPIITKNQPKEDEKEENEDEFQSARISKKPCVEFVTPVKNKRTGFFAITPHFRSQPEFEDMHSNYNEKEEEEEESNEPVIRINSQNVLRALSIIESAVRKLIDKNENQIALSENEDDFSSQRLDSSGSITQLIQNS